MLKPDEPTENRTSLQDPFEYMLDHSEALAEEGYPEFAIAQCHMTLDSFKGNHLYEQLKKLNNIRNGIVHNRRPVDDVNRDTATAYREMSSNVIRFYQNSISSHQNNAPDAKHIDYFFFDKSVNVSADKNVAINSTLFCDVRVFIFEFEFKNVSLPKIRVEGGNSFLMLYGVEFHNEDTMGNQITGFQIHRIWPRWVNGIFKIGIYLRVFEPLRNALELLSDNESGIQKCVEFSIVGEIERIVIRSSGLEIDSYLAFWSDFKNTINFKEIPSPKSDRNGVIKRLVKIKIFQLEKDGIIKEVTLSDATDAPCNKTIVAAMRRTTLWLARCAI